MKKYSGIIFVILLFISAATVSLPSDNATPEKLSSFYAQHGGIVIITQLIGIVAALALIIFAKLLAERNRKLYIPTVTVAVAGTLPAYPIIAMGIFAESANNLTTLNHISTYADLFLFVVIAYFAISVYKSYERSIKYFAAIVGTLALLRSLLGVLNNDSLNAVAPILFLMLVVGMNVHILRNDRHKFAKLAQ